MCPLNLCATSRQPAPSSVQPYRWDWCWRHYGGGHPGQGGGLSLFGKENGLLSRGFQGLEGLRHDSSSVRRGLEQPRQTQKLTVCCAGGSPCLAASGAPSAAQPAAEPQSSGLCPRPGYEGQQRDAALEDYGLSVTVISPNSLSDVYVLALCGSGSPGSNSERWGRLGRPQYEGVVHVPPGRPECSVGPATWLFYYRNPVCGPLRHMCSGTTWTSSEATRAS